MTDDTQRPRTTDGQARRAPRGTADARSGTTAPRCSRRGVLASVGAGVGATALGGLTGVGSAQASERTLPWLYRDGNELKDPEGNRVVLHGINIPDPKRGTPEWGHMHSERAVREAAGVDGGPWNSRVIRVPMQPQDIGDHGPGSVDPVAFDEGQLVDYCDQWVDPVVEECREHGLYVMLDYHRHWPDGPDWNDTALDEEITMFWNVVAERYADQSHCILEMYNEPTTPYPGAGDPTVGVDVTDPESEETWLAWKDTAQPWVNLIRNHSQHQVIVIGSPRWSQWTYWAANSEEFDGQNLAYAGHVYAHENLRPLSTYFGEPSEEVPVFMSEFGWEPGEEAPYLTGSREVEGQQFSDLYEEYDTIHTQAWCFDHSWTPDLLDKDYNNDEYLVREGWGEWTVDFLDARADQDLPMAPTDAGPVDPPDPGDAPPAPDEVTVEDRDVDTITVSWSPVSEADQYVVTVDQVEDEVTADTEYTFTGLEAATTYTIGVASRNPDGTSAPTTVLGTTLAHDVSPCEEVDAADGELVDDQWVCDVSDDGTYRDVNADGAVGQDDVVVFFENQHRDAWKREDLFDFSESGSVGHGDVVALFEHVSL